MLLPKLLKQEGVVTVVVMMLMMMPDYSEGQTTCTAITTVYNTSVTCLFAEDISQLGFNIQFFFPNTSVDPKIILACNRQMTGGLACYKGDQILFDEKQKIVDRFTLSSPPSLNKLKGGHYRCQAIRSLVKRSEFCPLTYRDVPRLVPLELHSEPPPSTDGNDVMHVFILVAVVINLILFIVMISAGIYLGLKRKRRAAEKERPGGVEDATENIPLGGVEDATKNIPLGGVEDAKENIPLGGLETKIPEGLAQYYYNKGWTAALKDETIRMTAGEPSPAKPIEPSTQPPIQPDKRDPQVEGGERTATVVVRRPTLIAGEKQSSKIQPEAAEEATPMLGKRQGGSDTSEREASGERKTGNTPPGKSSKDESERGETTDGEERHGEEEETDIKAKGNKKSKKRKSKKSECCHF